MERWLERWSERRSWLLARSAVGAPLRKISPERTRSAAPDFAGAPNTLVVIFLVVIIKESNLESHEETYTKKDSHCFFLSFTTPQEI